MYVTDISMLDKMASKSVRKSDESDRGKRRKTLNEVKPVKNKNKNLQSFLEISPVQNEVFPSHKLQDHA